MNKPEEYKSPLLDQLLGEITSKEREKVWIKMRIASRIDDLLKARKMQKKRLAEECELKSSSMVTKWLSGGHNFTVDTLVDISFALGVSAVDLVKPVENRAIVSYSITVRVPSLSRQHSPYSTTANVELIGRSSATGQRSMVSEPLLAYGHKQPCLA